jgi:serine/threonine-protein kinase
VNAARICPQCGTEYPANARFCELDGTALRSVSATGDLEGSIIADRYLILKKLGEGGMGQVYLAEHVKMGRKSALKIMHPRLMKDVEAIGRFNREAANASRINHPNVAAIYDFGETSEGVIYLAMEFVDGQPLSRLVEREGILPPRRSAEIARQAAEALAVAHEMGIVHRDLKPDNIMVARGRDGADLVKVVDFGIAKAAGAEPGSVQQVTRTGMIVGTPEYMSPEQLSGETLDGRTDIYSLAIVAFNMLTGQLPFPAPTAQESMIMRLTERPKRLAELRPDVPWPPDVEGVMDRALARDRSQRYQTAGEFGRDLSLAIARMADTMPMEPVRRAAGGVVPPTRVAPGAAFTPLSATGVGDAPVVSPRPLSPSPASGAAKPATPPVRRYAPVVAGVTAVLVALAIVIPRLEKSQTPGTTGTSPGGTARSLTQPSAEPQARQRRADTRTGADRRDEEPLSRRIPKSDGAPLSSLDIDETLSRLERDAKQGPKADGVLTQLQQIWGQLQNDDERARGNYIRYRAYLTKDEGDRACASIREAQQGAKNPAAKRTYADYAAAC